jgi:hypothetical protein
VTGQNPARISHPRISQQQEQRPQKAPTIAVLNSFPLLAAPDESRGRVMGEY